MNMKSFEESVERELRKAERNLESVIETNPVEDEGTGTIGIESICSPADENDPVLELVEEVVEFDYIVNTVPGTDLDELVEALDTAMFEEVVESSLECSAFRRAARFLQGEEEEAPFSPRGLSSLPADDVSALEECPSEHVVANSSCFIVNGGLTFLYEGNLTAMERDDLARWTRDFIDGGLQNSSLNHVYPNITGLLLVPAAVTDDSDGIPIFFWMIVFFALIVIIVFILYCLLRKKKTVTKSRYEHTDEDHRTIQGIDDVSEYTPSARTLVSSKGSKDDDSREKTLVLNDMASPFGQEVVAGNTLNTTDVHVCASATCEQCRSISLDRTVSFIPAGEDDDNDEFKNERVKRSCVPVPVRRTNSSMSTGDRSDGSIMMSRSGSARESRSDASYPTANSADDVLSDHPIL